MDHAKMGGDCSSDGADQELHVLAVDDNLVDRKVIERLLKISCCKVTTVESGARALQYLGLDEEKSSEGFDVLKVNLIMTDYSMPGMTGFELLQKIKASAKLKQIPVVIMSSENIIARIDRCLEEGAEDYLLKPVRLSDVQRVRACILGAAEKKSGNGLLVVPSSPPGPLVKLDLPPTLDSCDTCPVGPIAVALNCESPMPLIPVLGLGPGEPRHQLHVKCPGLVVASD